MMSKKKKDKSDESTKTKPKRSLKKSKVSLVVDGAPAAATGSPGPGKIRRADTETKEPVVELSSDDIALRAYYIAERRNRLNLPGDETGDWVEAERQLRREALKEFS
jgi:hypothetical protein